MIIDRNLMIKLGLTTNFNNLTLKWEVKTVPIPCVYSDTKSLKLSRSEIKAFMMPTAEPRATIEMTDRVLKILDRNYKEANMDQIADNSHDLTSVQQEMLRVLQHEN